MERERFVNREAELRQVEAAWQALAAGQPHGRAQLVELCGVAGIGKTALLRQIQRRCQEQGLPVLWIELGPGASPETFLSRLRQQLPQLQGPSEPSASSEPGPAGEHGAARWQLEAQGLRALLAQRGAAVLLLDGLEAAGEAVTRQLVALLQALGPDAPLLVVLTALRAIPLEGEPAIAGSVSVLELGALDRSSCEAYLAAGGLALVPAEREWLWRWTGGYPLALEVLAEAIRAGLRPRKSAQQRQLSQLLMERVIRQRVLAPLPGEERAGAERLLRLLAVPRRFTAQLLQELIEQFAPELTQASPLAYFFLPRTLSVHTNVLRWSAERAGYSVEEPVRRLVLLAWQLEEPERLRALHRWLAACNQRLAGRVGGSDRVRALREWLYHSALGLGRAALAQALQELAAALRQEPREVRWQWIEEARRDHDLQEALGERAPRWLSGLQALERDD